MDPFRAVSCALLLSAAASPATAMPLVDCLAPAATCTLRQWADQAGIEIGAAVEPAWIAEEPQYAATLAAEFGSLTPENRMKWPEIHPSPDAYDFGPADALVDFAQTNDMAVRGHTLVWGQMAGNGTPDYVRDAQSAQELRTLVAEHIGTVAGRYAGKVDSWDVVNEPLVVLGNELDPNPFFELLGPDYIAEAFALAKAADPDARLFLNEAFVELAGPRFDAFHDLVRELLAQGVPIDGVGLQGHLLFPIFLDPQELRTNLERIVDLGLEVEITELDIAVSFLPEAERDAYQRQAYFDVFTACLEVEGCNRITLWGFTDAHTWLDDFLGNPAVDPLLFDEDYRRKPAYYGVRDALRRSIVPEPGRLWLALAAAAFAARRLRWRPRGSRTEQLAV